MEHSFCCGAVNRSLVVRFECAKFTVMLHKHNAPVARTCHCSKSVHHLASLGDWKHTSEPLKPSVAELFHIHLALRCSLSFACSRSCSQPNLITGRNLLIFWGFGRRNRTGNG